MRYCKPFGFYLQIIVIKYVNINYSVVILLVYRFLCSSHLSFYLLRRIKQLKWFQKCLNLHAHIEIAIG